MSSDSGSTANPGYALGQLHRALATAAADPDPAVRTRAASKVARWTEVLAGMESGRLTIGSRTPVDDTPAWVTLEVAHGGFATGRYLAEQPLDEQESAWLRALATQPGQTDRERLNVWLLSDEGQALLLRAMEEDRCVVELPEHAALPTAALLLARGHQEQALDLIARLWPLMHRLRFTPHLTAEPQPLTALARLESVGAVRERLQAATIPDGVQAMNASLSIWNPLHDDLLALWARTVDGEPPHLVGIDGSSAVAGGWPCRRFPASWPMGRQDLLERYARAAADANTPTRHLHRKSSTTRLVEALRACPHDSSSLSGREVGWIRRILADNFAAAGEPDSERRRSLRTQQAEMAARPTRQDVAQVLAARLQLYPSDGGLPDDSVTAPITVDELPALRQAQPVPSSLRMKVRRALEAPVAQLVDQGIITSGEVLARVLPQVTAQHVASGVADPAAAALYARTYAAFRRRRSVLLLDLEHQVRLSELPWVAALEVFRSADDEAQMAAAASLREVVELAVSAFPYAILPNTLLTELSSLSRRAGLQVPLVEEVAADIFVGTFTQKWRSAAEVASRTLQDSLYARYYDLPPAVVWQSTAFKPKGLRQRLRGTWKKETAEDFTDACRIRSREAGGPGIRWDTAGNGTILEQSHILTTHNLAALTEALDLQVRWEQLAPLLVERTFDWIVRSWQHLPQERHAQLTAIKNLAYAWRQAVFLMSACPPSEQLRQAQRLSERVTTAAPALLPVVQGLEHMLSGGRFDASGHARAGQGRRLLGWSVGPHWLMQPERGQRRG